MVKIYFVVDCQGFFCFFRRWSKRCTKFGYLPIPNIKLAVMKSTTIIKSIVVLLTTSLFSLCLSAQCGSCKGFTTFTQGGWGAPAKGENAASYMYAHFSKAFGAKRVTIGCAKNAITFTNASAISSFLPQGGTPSLLKGGIQENVVSKNLTVLAGQLLAATLNVGFDGYDVAFGKNSRTLTQLEYKGEGVFKGKTVAFIIDQANAVIGGCSAVYSVTDLNTVLTQFNENFDNGTSDGGLFVCASPNAPIVADTTIFCMGDKTATLTAKGSNVLWYTSASSNLGMSTPPSINTTQIGIYEYFVSQTIDDCESNKTKAVAKVNNCHPKGPETTDVLYCKDAQAEPLTAVGSQLKWYSDSLGSTYTTTAPIPATDSVGVQRFFVSQMVDGYESAKSTLTVTVTSCFVSSGSTGGTESKSLGDIITQRILHKAQNNESSFVNYAQLQPISTDNQAKQVFGTMPRKENGIDFGALSLDALMPKNIPGYIGYYTSPKDLTTFTNAKDVVAIDFTKQLVPQAVVFATQTNGEIYNHSKAVCDRLKGASVVLMDTMMVNGFTLVRFALKGYDGNIEYATCFSISNGIINNGKVQLESNWLTKDYYGGSTMCNYQVWAVSKAVLRQTAAATLNTIGAYVTILQGSKPKLPTTYMISGIRKKHVLTILIQNNSANTNGQLVIKQKMNEQSTMVENTIPVELNAYGTKSVNIEVNDMNECEVALVRDENVVDLLYISDGSWAINYFSSNTTLEQFAITNNKQPSTTPNDAFPVNRNVQIKAISSDFVSVYKILQGGGLPVNLTGYTHLHFVASGGHQLRITLVKKGIANWNNQYSYTLPLASDKKNYHIPLSSFVNTENKAVFVANDITTIVFSIEIASGNKEMVNTFLGNIQFDNNVPNIFNAKEQPVTAYPNPSVGQLNVRFAAVEKGMVTLRLIDIATGKTVCSQKATTQVGTNNVALAAGGRGLAGTYLLAIDDTNGQYQKQLITITSK